MRKARSSIENDTMKFTMEGHEILSSLPKIFDGDNSHPSPGVYFISSLVNCALATLAYYCHSHEISVEGLQIQFEGIVEKQVYQNMTYKISLPADFPKSHIKTVSKILDTCAVKKYATHLPAITYEIED